jgi:tRNA A37 threonylcarbamoyladenosine modification protein TsaB
VRTLSLENSTATGSLAIADDGKIVFEADFSGSAELAVQLQRAVRAGTEMGEIVVGIGPGSYTGLRVAIASALGLALARGWQKYGCPSVLGYPDPVYRVVGDARRGLLFLAEIADHEFKSAPHLMSRSDLRNEIDADPETPIFTVDPLPEYPEISVRRPRAACLLSRRSGWGPLGEPIYLKDPHITTPRKS